MHQPCDITHVSESTSIVTDLTHTATLDHTQRSLYRHTPHTPLTIVIVLQLELLSEGSEVKEGVERLIQLAWTDEVVSTDERLVRGAFEEEGERLTQRQRTCACANGNQMSEFGCHVYSSEWVELSPQWMDTHTQSMVCQVWMVS